MRHVAAALAAFLCLAEAAAAEQITAGGPQVARMGRTVDAADGAVRFAYPGVSFFLQFEGTRLTLDAASTGEKSWLDVIVDGAVRTIHVAPGGGRYVLVEAATPALHTVQVLHRSETWHGTVTLRSLATDGRFLAPPALPARRLMFLGDSVTCGEALERTPPGPKQAIWWNPSCRTACWWVRPCRRRCTWCATAVAAWCAAGTSVPTNSTWTGCTSWRSPTRPGRSPGTSAAMRRT
ncbi:hypothetical protein [Pseudoduganella armeniaca]|uniref:Carbohydrate esterase 2 N-terminal domain-containing protein n=1 Tax=Pseudoduganella armeniaca TaxID=2072590 RepID=A0A2R4CE77_9BURK|nr:hypothetical protein C9I28_20635 [Pseudoduganella armeniaca]